MPHGLKVLETSVSGHSLGTCLHLVSHSCVWLKVVPCAQVALGFKLMSLNSLNTWMLELLLSANTCVIQMLAFPCQTVGIESILSKCILNYEAQSVLRFPGRGNFVWRVPGLSTQSVEKVERIILHLKTCREAKSTKGPA